MAKRKCGATIDLSDGRTLTCTLPQGHDGIVHDDNGEQWAVEFPHPEPK